MRQRLYYLNKLRSHLGMANALNVYNALKVSKTGTIKLDFIKYPFSIRAQSMADSSTFNEVMLRREYDFNFPFQPKTIIDAGANIGLTSIFLANKYPDAQLVSVEPDASNFVLLKKNTEFYSNIILVQSAIWNKMASLIVVDHGRGENSFTVEETQCSSACTFLSLSISDIMREQSWDVIDVLKMDIEGAELEVFSNGYEDWLPKTKVLIVETHDRFRKGTSRAVFSTISKYDFSCRIKGANLVFINNELVKSPVKIEKEVAALNE